MDITEVFPPIVRHMYSYCINMVKKTVLVLYILQRQYLFHNLQKEHVADMTISPMALQYKTQMNQSGGSGGILAG